MDYWHCARSCARMRACGIGSLITDCQTGSRDFDHADRRDFARHHRPERHCHHVPVRLGAHERARELFAHGGGECRRRHRGRIRVNQADGSGPGTTYYYALVATNSSGTSSTPVETLKTTGNPAPTITTEPATGIGRYVPRWSTRSTPNNQATTYYFEYGLTDGYGFQTMPKTLPTGTTPVFVTQVIPGIAPGTVFHYRLVATHGSVSASYGPDQTFETYPWPRPRTTAIFHVTPRHPAHAPVSLVSRARSAARALMPSTVTCSGKVTLRSMPGAES